MLELANVARPVVRLEAAHGRPLDGLPFALVTRREEREEMIDERGDVVGALAQRGDLQLDDVEPIK